MPHGEAWIFAAFCFALVRCAGGDAAVDIESSNALLLAAASTRFTVEQRSVQHLDLDDLLEEIGLIPGTSVPGDCLLASLSLSLSLSL